MANDRILAYVHMTANLRASEHGILSNVHKVANVNRRERAVM